ncbi:MAG: DNA-3-methyladenine glycosylase I [Cyanobacteria bacterium SIG30]|nr:DNA-3-methyladenine glycosylase I [Cyanobacteria bacterium SIG30]
MKKRCFWVNLKNPIYVKYHDNEWSKPKHNDKELYELLILEMFQAGLSWECVLNKRENFRKAYDNFDIEKVVNYDSDKILELLNNKNIIRNKSKIIASIENSKIFKNIQNEFGSFDKYIWGFTNNEIIKEECHLRVSSSLSDLISFDLKKRGMKFVGTKIIYSFLQSVGIIDAHQKECFCFKN